MRLHAAIIGLGLLAAVASAAPLTPLVNGWEQFFKLDWQVETRNGKPLITGHILNDWGMPARSIQLLVEGLDAKGDILAQKVEWLGTSLTPGMRAYFEVPAPAPDAPNYRVRVFAFEWVQTNGIRKRL